MANIECELCGGNNFYKESGFYFCSDCQVQSQAIQEHEHEEPDGGNAPAVQKVTRLKRKQKEEKAEDQLTSWECYNFILLGIVNELIELGASKELKRTVKTLWRLYLKYLEVIGKNDEHKPRLQAVNSRVDAELIYGRKIKRFKRRRSGSVSSGSGVSSSMDTSSREVNRKKKAVDSEEYLTQQSDATSLHNQSLATLKSTDTNLSARQEKYLLYSRAASTEMKKVMTKNKFLKHRHDVDMVLEDLALRYRQASTSHLKSVDVLTRNRIYSIVYLGLLIIKDEIQLGDMLRFIKHGYLSYNEFKHFFPEELSNKRLNIATYIEKTAFLCHYSIRQTTAKLINALKIASYVPIPNLVEMARRYCYELNLPDELAEYVECLLSTAPPNMQTTYKNTITPNYEGRTLSFIIFTLKLLFGLDGQAEEKLSDAADHLNELKIIPKPLFNFTKWLEHIEYRKAVIMEEHYPSNFTQKEYKNNQLFVNFMNDQKAKYEEKVIDDYTIKMMKNNLEKLQSMQPVKYGNINFKHSLKPFSDYTKTILENNTNEKYSEFILSQDFRQNTLSYLIQNDFFKLVCTNLDELTNEKIKFVPVRENEIKNRAKRKDLKQTIIVDLSDIEIGPKKSLNNEVLIDSQVLHERYLRSISKRHLKNVKYLFREDPELIQEHIYQPSEKFWLQAHDVSIMTHQEFEKLFETFPTSFKLILKECARISEQPLKKFYEEYSLTELYLCYKVKYRKRKAFKPILDERLKTLVNKAVKNW